jgi:hypothetical protein
MAYQQKFHIKDDGTAQKCGRFKHCTKDHWGSVEAIRIHLDNIAYKAEVAAKVREFQNAQMNQVNGYFTAAFSVMKGQNKEPRAFREKIDNYIAHHGKPPRWLKALMREKMGHWQDYAKHDVYFDIQSIPEIDPVHGEVTAPWTVKAIHHDPGSILSTSPKNVVIYEADLNFSNAFDRKESNRILREAYLIALKKTGRQHTADEEYEEYMAPMLERIREMVSAVEAVRKGDFWAFHHGLGDFKESTDGKVIVDVIYDKSILTGQSIEKFFRDCKTHGYTWVKDIDIRVADRIIGHPRPSWMLSRADGVWTVEVLNSGGEGYTAVVQDAEDIRSHVYWHIMRQYYPANQQELALKHADYAEQIFLSVEEALASLTF